MPDKEKEKAGEETKAGEKTEEQLELEKMVDDFDEEIDDAWKDEPEDKGKEKAGEEETKEKEKEKEEDKEKDEDEKTKNIHVPYPRFKEVNDEKNALREKLDKYESSQQQDVKKKEVAASAKAELSSEQITWLRENSPELYQTHVAKQQADAIMQEVEQRQDEKQKTLAAEGQQQQYVQHFSGRIKSDFKDIENQESEWFKGITPRVRQLREEYPGIGNDLGTTHLALRLAQMERELAGIKVSARKEIQEELKRTRAQKKSQGAAGQAKTFQSSAKSDDEDDWGGPASFEKE